MSTRYQRNVYSMEDKRTPRQDAWFYVERGGICVVVEERAADGSFLRTRRHWIRKRSLAALFKEPKR